MSDDYLAKVEAKGSTLMEEPDLPPVVARMVVEIRSDGTRTVARGALEDRVRGETVQLRLESGSPLSLAKKLTESLLGTKAFANNAVARWLSSRGFLR